MKTSCRLFSLLFTWAVLAVNSFILEFTYFKIGAFDVQYLDPEKLSNKAAMGTLVKIIQRYDILFIQEMVDESEPGIGAVLTQVNKGSEQYAMAVSGPLHHSARREQYAYLYRKGNISVIQTHQHEDRDGNFERPPFSVKFRSHNTEIKEFTLIGVHISSINTFEELTALTDVFYSIYGQFGTEDIIILGDLQADCGSIIQTQIQRLSLRTSDFHWLIMDTADTSVAESHCAFDRFIVRGETMMNAVVRYSAGVFRFDLVYALTQQQTGRVSNNYPIELFLKSARRKRSNDNRDRGMAKPDTDKDVMGQVKSQLIESKATIQQTTMEGRNEAEGIAQTIQSSLNKSTEETVERKETSVASVIVKPSVNESTEEIVEGEETAVTSETIKPTPSEWSKGSHASRTANDNGESLGKSLHGYIDNDNDTMVINIDTTSNVTNHTEPVVNEAVSKHTYSFLIGLVTWIKSVNQFLFS